MSKSLIRQSAETGEAYPKLPEWFDFPATEPILAPRGQLYLAVFLRGAAECGFALGNVLHKVNHRLGHFIDQKSQELWEQARRTALACLLSTPQAASRLL